MNNYITEALGAFFLVTAVGFTGDPYTIGLTLAVLIYCGGHVSGGHYNPAVSLAVYLRKGIRAQQLIIYWIAQLIGASLAAIFFLLIHGKTFAVSPSSDYTFFQWFLIELVGTLALTLVVLSVATASKLRGNYIYGFAIGMTLACMASIGGKISGGAFNPAVALGPDLIDALHGGRSISNALLYIAGPFTGATIAASLFGFMNEE
ncbi:MAG: aquaporin [Oligoflexia bacterium]|nr:aquaporin [Oligoflexia bacterium]